MRRAQIMRRWLSRRISRGWPVDRLEVVRYIKTYPASIVYTQRNLISARG